MTLYEVLSKTANGHRTVNWIYADDEAAAIDYVETELELDVGAVVLDAAEAPAGLGSGD